MNNSLAKKALTDRINYNRFSENSHSSDSVQLSWRMKNLLLHFFVYN